MSVQSNILGPNQIAWIQEWILNKNFRDKEDGPLIKPKEEKYAFYQEKCSG